MKMVFHQFFVSFKKSIFISTAICFALAVGLFLMLGCINYFTASKDKLENFFTAYTDDEVRYSHMVGILNPLNKAVTEGKADEFIQNLSAFNRELTYGNVDFEWYSCYESDTFCVKDYTGSELMIFGYGEGGARNSRRIDGDFYTTVKHIFAAPGFMEKFSIQLAEGEGFADYRVEPFYDGMEIPVVLGDAYRKSYSIGDRLTVNISSLTHATKTQGERAYSFVTARVTGFMMPGSVVLNRSADYRMTNLDYFIISPPLDITSLISDQYDDRLKPLYWHLGYSTMGVYITPKSENDTRPFFELADKYGMSRNYFSLGESMLLGNSFRRDSEKYFNDLLLTAVMVVISSSICLALNITNKLVGNFKRYAILQLSGCKYSDVKLYMIAESAIFTLAAFVLAYIAALFLGESVFSYTRSTVFGISAATISPLSILLVLLIVAAINVMVQLLPFIRLRRTEFDTLLRGRE